MSFDAPPRSEPPVALPDRYRVLRHIATGGMASVWCADDLVLGRRVAVKVLAERFAHDPLAVQRFKREARAAARVSGHPHVVTVYDVGEVGEDADHPATDATWRAGRAFIVMEFLAGGTVADALHHDTVRRHEALRWLGEAASALDHAHARGIVHRDIKPANFLLDRSRVLHVADFGIARLTTEETLTSSDQLFGTAAYLSPEQALGREATGASDRYALAVAAFELLAGERPFSAPHFSAQARQHIEEPPPAASEIDRTLPPAVDDVLFAGLAKDPAARPRSAGEFVTALGDALSGRPAAGYATPPSPRWRPAVHRPDPAAPPASTAAARRRESTRTLAPRPPGPEARHRRRAVALGGLLVAVLLTAGFALAATRGSSGSGDRIADRPATSARHHRSATHARVQHVVNHARPAPTPSTTATTTAPTPEELQDQGHQEMLDGDYDTAIPTLKQAVSSAPPESLTYAYALYDLGRSEVLSGDPQAAIPVLRERLKIPNQRATVQSLLDQALDQAGEGHAPTSGGVAPTSGTTPTGATRTAPAAPGRGSGGAGLSGGGPAAGGPGTTTVPGTTTPGTTTPNRAQPHHHGFSPLTLITAVAGG